MKERLPKSLSRHMLPSIALMCSLCLAVAGSPQPAERVSLGAITFKPHSEAAAPAFLDQDFIRSLHPEDLLAPFWDKVRDPRCAARVPQHAKLNYFWRWS